MEASEEKQQKTEHDQLSFLKIQEHWQRIQFELDLECFQSLLIGQRSDYTCLLLQLCPKILNCVFESSIMPPLLGLIWQKEEVNCVWDMKGRTLSHNCLINQRFHLYHGKNTTTLS